MLLSMRCISKTTLKMCALTLVCTQTLCTVPMIGTSVRDSAVNKATKNVEQTDHAQLIWHSKVLSTMCAPSRISAEIDS